ncbi:MAG TPA: hypothetical protein VFE90_21365 [Myxococcales bacterium]|jgi:hypothetical protein|nr:hypothetical protein [Myxococcales bacterium]
MLRGTFSALLLLATVACAGAGKQAQSQTQPVKDAKPVANNDKNNIVCRMERPTGSNIPERVCRYVNIDTTNETQRTQDYLRNAQGNSGPVNPN